MYVLTVLFISPGSVPGSILIRLSTWLSAIPELDFDNESSPILRGSLGEFSAFMIQDLWH